MILYSIICWAVSAYILQKVPQDRFTIYTIIDFIFAPITLPIIIFRALFQVVKENINESL